MKFRLGWKIFILLFFPLIIWGVLRSVPLQEILDNFQHLQAWQVFLLVLINLGILQILSTRWWLVLRAQGHHLPYVTLAGYRLAGFSLSYFTPGTQFGGEPLLVYALHHRHGVPVSTAIASVTLDKLIEVLTNFSFLALGMIFILESNLFNGWNLTSFLPVMASMLGLPLLYLLALSFGRKPVSWALEKLSKRWKNSERLQQGNRLISIAETQASDYCRARPGWVLGLYLFSLFVWGMMVGEYWLSLRFLGLWITHEQAMITLTAARLALLLPVPGGLGTLEVSQIVAIQALGFDPVFGASIALLIRGRDLLFAGVGLWLSALILQRGSKADQILNEREYSS
jgi:uncharacterized protein (TIRG00374 family)